MVWEISVGVLVEDMIRYANFLHDLINDRTTRAITSVDDYLQVFINRNLLRDIIDVISNNIECLDRTLA